MNVGGAATIIATTIEGGLFATSKLGITGGKGLKALNSANIIDTETNAVNGAAFRHRTKWALNEGGARSDKEAILLAEKYDVYIAEDVKVTFLDDEVYDRRFKEFGDSFASYGHISTDNLDKQVTWKSTLANKDGVVEVFVRKSVLDSDEAIIAVLHHETHEIEALRDVFARRVSMSVREYRDLISDSKPGNFHWEAVDVGDQAVWQFRQDKKG